MCHNNTIFLLRVLALSHWMIRTWFFSAYLKTDKFSLGPHASTLPHTYLSFLHHRVKTYVHSCVIQAQTWAGHWSGTGFPTCSLLVWHWGASDFARFLSPLSIKVKSWPLYPITESLNFLKILSCNGLVEKSATILSVGQYTTLISPDLTLSCTKKNLMLTCLELPVQEFLPLTSIQIVLSLSWNNNFSLTL